jgi:hypothetical protein
MVALQSLVGAIRLLGIPRDIKSGVVLDLVKGFIEQASALEGWKKGKDEQRVQFAFDLAFLSLIGGNGRVEDPEVNDLLSSVSSYPFHPNS